MVKGRKIISMCEERLICDECGTEMKCTEVLMSSLPQYVYCCPKCHKHEVCRDRYPRTAYTYEEEQ